MKPATSSSLDQTRLAALKNALASVQDQLSLPQLVGLLTIAMEPGLSVKELADRMNLPQASTSRYISVLLGRYQGPSGSPTAPLISQEVSTDDPRSRALFLNEHGCELLQDILRQLFIGPVAAEGGGL